MKRYKYILKLASSEEGISDLLKQFNCLLICGKLDIIGYAD